MIESNAIGLNVQVPGYDFDRLIQDVRFVDNDRNIDASEMPGPSPGL